MITMGLIILVPVLMVMDFFGANITDDYVEDNGEYAEQYRAVLTKEIKEGKGYVPLNRVLYFYLANDKLAFEIEKNPVAAQIPDQEIDGFRQDFIKEMDNDFNISNGLTAFYELIKYVNQGNFSMEAQALFDEILSIIGIAFAPAEILDAEIEQLIAERQIARENRDFVLSDKIRDDLKAQGIALLDTPDGVRWTRD